MWHAHDSSKSTLGDVFKGKNIILVGFPGGRVCTEKHIPGYVQLAEELAKRGVDKVVCVTTEDPAVVKELATRPSLQSPKVELLADRTGGFIRLLGLELGVLDREGGGGGGAGPRCQRFAGIVENGVLLKIRVEQSPGELKISDARSMMALWDDVYAHLNKQH